MPELAGSSDTAAAVVGFAAGLLANQTEVADVHGLGGIAQVIDLRHPSGAPALDAGDPDRAFAEGRGRRELPGAPRP